MPQKKKPAPDVWSEIDQITTPPKADTPDVWAEIDEALAPKTVAPATPPSYASMARQITPAPMSPVPSEVIPSGFSFSGTRRPAAGEPYEEPAVVAARTAAAQGAPTGATPGLLTPGNIDLASRPTVTNADGTVSTVRSVSVNVDGHEVLIPTVSDDGRLLSTPDAIALYRKTGHHLGVFDSPDSATAYAQRLHDAQAARLGPMGGPVASPFEQARAALATGPSLDEVAEGKKTGAPAKTAAPIPVTPRLGSAKTGGLATQPPAGQSIFDQPITAAIDTTVGGVRQIGAGAGEIAAAARDTSAPAPSNAPFLRSRTGALYQPPPPIDPRVIKGTADVLEGGMAASTPLLVASGVAAPVETAAALAKGAAAAKATEKLASAAGATEDEARLLSAVAGGLAAGVPLRDTIEGAVRSAAAKTGEMADAAVPGRRVGRDDGKAWDPVAKKWVSPGEGDVVAETAAPKPAPPAPRPPNGPDVPRLEADNLGRGAPPEPQAVWDAVDTVVKPAETAETITGVWNAVDDAVAPSEPRSAQGPTTPSHAETPTTPAAVRPGTGESVGPVAPSPEPPSDVSTVAPTTPPEFTPVGEEPAYNGPDRRGAARVSTPEEDRRYTEMREKIARGEPTGTQAARDAFAERQRVEDLRPEEPPREQPAPPPPIEVPREASSTEANPHVSTGYDPASLTTAERRELRRMHAELDNMPFVKRNFIDAGVGRGGNPEVIGGAGGAPVFHDIGGSTRGQVQMALKRVLDGKKPSAVGKRAIDVARRRIKDDGTVTLPSLPMEAGESGVPPEAGPDDIRARANARVADPSDLDFLARRYEQYRHFGKIVSRDNAKELFYRQQTPEERTALNDAVSDAAGKVADAVYARRLAEPKGYDASVVLTSGGTGSGKTTVGGKSELGHAADVVFDSQGTDQAAMARRIAQARESGRSVDHVYVYRDPFDAWIDGVMPRAEEIGRPVSIEGHVKSHGDALRSVLATAAAHDTDPGYRLTVYDNTGRAARQLPKEEGRRFLAEQAEAYNEDDVRQTIREATDSAHAVGAVPDGLYKAYIAPREGGGHPAAGSGRRGQGSEAEEVPGTETGPVSERRGVPGADEDLPEEVASEPDDVWKDVEEATKPREFSSTQVDLAHGDADAVRAAAAKIPDADLADDGREEQPHITVKFGLHTNDAADVRRVLADEPPITVTLGKTSIFPAKDGGDYDVVKVDVDSPDLHRLNAKIAGALEHTDTHPEYKPHVTLAYVKPGLGKKYVGRDDLAGRTLTFKAITFSGKDRQLVSVPLGGSAKAPLPVTSREKPPARADVPVTPRAAAAEPDATEHAFTAKNLQQVFGLTKAESTATMALVKAMGLDPARLALAKGQGLSPETLQQLQSAPPIFYSALARAVEAKMPNRASAEQILKIASNPQSGVKAEELKWSGLETWLKDQTGPVTKDAVLDFLHANQIRVDEVTLGGALSKDVERQIREIERKRDYGGQLSHRQAQKKIDALRAQASPAKFDRHTLPGGENYRELLLTLHGKPSAFDPAKVEIHRHVRSATQGTTAIVYDGEPVITYSDDPQLQDDGSYQQKPESHWIDVARQLYEQGDRINRVKPRGDGFVAGHFEQPNVLVHLRINDRTSADGKRVLFIEEIQSDWHQKGRREGYKAPPPDGFDDKIRAARLKLEAELEKDDRFGFDTVAEARAAVMANPDFAERWSASPATVAAANEYLPLVKENKQYKGGIPDAPFKTTWHELALKRALRYAADKGYDSIAWTTGEQQNARYDLSKQVKTIYAAPAEDGKFEITIDDHNDTAVYDTARTGPISSKDLEELIGKEMAEKIVALKEPHTFSGLDLKMGGKGMRGFYDDMLPRFLNKYAKPFGGKVGKTQVSVGSDLSEEPRYVGPALSESQVSRIARDFEREQGYGGDTLHGIISIANRMQRGYTFTQAMEEAAGAWSREDFANVAEALGGSTEGTTTPKTADVHALDITPEMRTGVLSGQPLFQRPGSPAFDQWFRQSKVVDESGKPLRVYHGTQRLDRFGPVLLKKRATSGPMPFFTTDPEIASRYSVDKQDTSLADEDVHTYASYFRLKVGKKQTVNLDRAWHFLTPEQRATIAARAPRVTQDDRGKLYVADEGHNDGIGGYDQHIKEARGNHFVALIDEWLNSAALFDDEQRFDEVLKLAGAPVADIEYHDPHAQKSGVVPVYLSIQRPLVTNQMPASVVDRLQSVASKMRSRGEAGGADPWDKRTREPKDWVRSLREDLDKGANSFVWSSIPDWVTKELKALGYDGIHDTGGKMGGQKHDVWIPFEPGQVKSAVGNRGTYNPKSSNILYQVKPKGQKTDLFDTGEEQPRLPGAEDVRETEIATPEFERNDDFRLTAETSKRKGKQDSLFQSAYHGSPHVFERFSLHHIGKGEGVQAYGWGLYFASKREVAAGYRERLSTRNDSPEQRLARKQITEAGSVEKAIALAETKLASYDRALALSRQVIKLIDAEPFDRAAYDRVAAERDAAVSDAGDFAATSEPQIQAGRKFLIEALNILRQGNLEKGGRLYKVEIPEDEDFLDWDKPASQQSPKVQETLRKLGIEWEPVKPWTPSRFLKWTESKTFDRLWREDVGIRQSLQKGITIAESGDKAAFADWYARHQGFFPKGMVDPRGESIYRSIGYQRASEWKDLGIVPHQRLASEALARHGVAGIKYDDGLSRGKGDNGTHNYVVFDDKLVQIMEFDQGAKGAVEFTEGGKAIIRALDTPDISTAVHEIAHVARRFLFDPTLAPEERAGITDEDIKTAAEWAGADTSGPNPIWDREAEEKFARGFERYLRDGDAPTAKLKALFAKFKQWLRDIYKRLRGSDIDVKITPEMRKVFDALVTRGELPVTPKRSGGGVSAMPIGTSSPLPASRGSAIPVTDRMRPSAIIEKLRKGLGAIPVNVGRFQQRAFGIYKVKPQAVRLRVANDVQTVAHEFGHHLDHAILQISRKDPRWRDELQALGQPTSRPSYSVGEQRKEGAAEFLRLYLIDPAAAKAGAPTYFAEFERKLNEHSDLKKVLLDAREDLKGLISQSPATRGKLMIDFSGDDSDSIYRRLKEDPKGAMRDLATAWIDDLRALRSAVEEMRDQRPLDWRQNAYVLARNARGTGGMAEGMLEHGVRGRNGRFLSGSLADAITPVKDQLQDFASYLVAKRVLEVQRLKGKETGMTAEEARAIIADIEQGPHAVEMRRAAENVYAYNRGLLQYAREYHALSDDQYKKLLTEVHYVPLQRVMDAVGGAFSGGGARKIANRTSPIKRMKGSGRDIVNPLESMIRNTFTIVDTVEKNRAMQALVRQADKSAGSAKWIEKVPTPQVATKFNLSQIEKEVRTELDAMGIDLPDNFDLDAFVKVFTPASVATPGQNLVTVIRDGKREFYEVHDQALYDAITAMGGKATSTLVEWASKPAALLRAGATLTPGFIARNPTRDTLIAAVQSRYGFIPVYDTVRGFLSLALGEDEAKLFLTSGVQQSSLVGADRDRLRKAIERMPAQSKAKFFANVALHPIDLLRAISESMESATRMGEFRLALNAAGQERRAGVLGMLQRVTSPNTPATDDETLTRATLAARDVTTDFSRGGSVAKEANRVYAFFNARVQGFVRAAETVKRDPTGTLLTMAALSALSYALWWLNKDDDTYAEIPDWEKNAYWHIPVNLFKRAGLRNSGFIKVAKPFEWATLPNMTEAALTYIKTRDKDALGRIKPAQDPKDLAFMLIPTALLPALEAAFNYDTFRDSPIVKPWDVGLTPELQRSEWTTDTAVQVGKLLNVSPAKVDHLIFGYGAGFARGVVEHGTDPALALGGLVTPKAQEPEKKWQRVPVVGTFYREGAFDSSSQSLKTFYDEYNNVINGERSANRLAKTDVGKARAFVKDASGDRWLHRRDEIKAAKKALEDIGDEVNTIYAAPPAKMTPLQKREALDREYERMVGIAREALGKPPLHRQQSPLPVTGR